MHYDGERSLRFAKHGMLSRKFWWVPHYDVGVLASHARVAVLLPLWFALHHVVWWMRHARQSFRGRLHL